jgi:hypothetical protein
MTTQSAMKLSRSYSTNWWASCLINSITCEEYTTFLVRKQAANYVGRPRLIYRPPAILFYLFQNVSVHNNVSAQVIPFQDYVSLMARINFHS